jgi:hypothetical protein
VFFGSFGKGGEMRIGLHVTIDYSEPIFHYNQIISLQYAIIFGYLGTKLHNFTATQSNSLSMQGLPFGISFDGKLKVLPFSVIKFI